VFAALAEKTGEVKLAANGQELDDLADAIESGSGFLELNTALDVRPYDVALSKLSIAVSDRQTVRIAVDRDGRRLLISGAVQHLAVLAQNLRGLAREGRPGEHLHIEYFPGHFYLDQQSAPFVVESTK
jgi:hypothetical protein